LPYGKAIPYLHSVIAGHCKWCDKEFADIEKHRESNAVCIKKANKAALKASIEAIAKENS